jgi:hypothetical protein
MTSDGASNVPLDGASATPDAANAAPDRPYACQKCRDQGWIPDSVNYKTHVECPDCMRPKRQASEYAAANLPVFVQDIEWRDIERTPDRDKLIENARIWLRGAYAIHCPGGVFTPRSKTQAAARRTFLIHGPPNSGKTMFASLMAKSLIKRGVRTYRGTLQRYTEAFFVKSGAPEAEEERAFRDRMRQTPVLILEMGDEPDHRYSGPRLVELLKGRMESGFCTIVVSALGPDRLLGKYAGDFCKGSELLKLFADKKFVLPNKLSGGGR